MRLYYKIVQSLVSIPEWFDLKYGFSSRSKILNPCFNSWMVRFKAYPRHQARLCCRVSIPEWFDLKWWRVWCFIRCWHVSIPEWFDLKKEPFVRTGGRRLRFNSWMVRFKAAPVLFFVPGRYQRFNSWMVRFKVCSSSFTRFSLFPVSIPEWFDLKLWVLVFLVLSLLRFNSWMVRFKAVLLYVTIIGFMSFNSWMVRFKVSRVTLWVLVLRSFNSWMVRFKVTVEWNPCFNS